MNENLSPEDRDQAIRIVLFSALGALTTSLVTWGIDEVRGWWWKREKALRKAAKAERKAAREAAETEKVEEVPT